MQLISMANNSLLTCFNFVWCIEGEDTEIDRIEEDTEIDSFVINIEIEVRIVMVLRIEVVVSMGIVGGREVEVVHFGEQMQCFEVVIGIEAVRLELMVPFWEVGHSEMKVVCQKLADFELMIVFAL
jgi:hypothetical protein